VTETSRSDASIVGRASGLDRLIDRVLGRHRSLLLNAGSLFGSTLLTGLLGAVYWAIAARLFAATAVGVGAAAISTMQLMAQLATFGLGTMLMGELAEHHASDRRLILSSLGVTGLVGAVLGLGFVFLSVWLVPDLGGLREPGGYLLFACGVATTASGLVLDQALLGLLRGGVQLLRNGIASVAKLAALVAIGLLVTVRTDGLALLLTWVVGVALSMVVLLAIPRGTGAERGRSVWRAVEGVAGLATRHHLLNLSILAPGLLLPLLITDVLSAEANAYFYIAYLIASFAWAVPAALGTAAYAAGARDLASLSSRIRVAFAICFVVGLALNAFLVVGAPLLLSIFGSAYVTQSTTLLRLLGLGIFPVTLNSLYVPIVRVERRFLEGALLMGLGLVVEFVIVAIWASRAGLDGAGVGWLVGYTIGIVPFVPTLWRVGVRGRVERITSDFLGRVPSGARPSAVLAEPQNSSDGDA